MKNKKIEEFITTLQAMANELNDTVDGEETETAIENTAAWVVDGEDGIMPYADSDAEDLHCYKSFALPDNITVQCDILKKNTSVVFDYFGSVTSPIGMTLKHVYRPNSGSTVFGKDFKLNVCETLSGTEYTDSLGDTYKKKDEYINGMKYSKTYPTFAEGLKKFNEFNGLSFTQKLILCPMYWLNNETVAKGFNARGYLVFVCDINKNYMHIVYNGNNVITGIEQGNENISNVYSYEFSYSGDNLSYFEDSYKRRVSFEYNAGDLNKIIYPDGRKLTLNYGGGLIEADSSDDYMHGVIMGKDIHITSRPISYRDQDGADTAAHALVNITISYGDTVIITDEDGNKEYYKFSNSGRDKEFYKEQNSVVTYAEKSKYVYDKSTDWPRHTTTVNIAPDRILNKTPFSNFNYNISSMDEQVYTAYDLYNHLVKEWYKHKCVGPSSYISYVRSCTYNEDDLVDGEDTEYCLYKIIDGREEQHQYYPYRIDYEYENRKLKKCSRYFVEEEATRGKDIEEYEYNEAGQVTRVISYNSLEPTKVFITERTYDSYGRVLTETDGSGLSTLKYLYQGNVAKPYCVVLPNGSAEYHYFDDRYRTNQVVLFDGANPVSNENTVTYNKEACTKYSDGSNNIFFGYNTERRLSSVSCNSSLLYSIEYNDRDGNGRLYKTGNVKVTNAKNEKFTVEHDMTAQKTTIKYGDNIELETTYLKSGLIDTETDGVSGEKVNYTYNKANTLQSYRVTKDGAETYKAQFEYGADGNLSAVKQNDFSYNYTYDSEIGGALNKITVSGLSINVYRDKQGRYTGRQVIKQYNSQQLLSESITYDTAGTLTTANGVKTKQTMLPSNITYSSGNHISYTYDKGGNIVKINKNGKVINYTYDKLNRLIREDNQLLNRTYIMSYDKNGNIMSKKEYSYYNVTLALNTLEYKYGLGRLMQINKENFITYDAVGNPITHRGNILGWDKGKRLIQYKSFKFEYDGRGRRTKKGNISFYYDYNDRLIASSNGLKYIYDHIGVAGILYNGSIYHYVRDIQNNVIAIVDSDGKTVVEYTYDAWGNHTVSGSNTTLGNLNPFRYRSYFYDTETKLYYLKTRYYDPAVGRFLNMDSIEYADPETINGLNLYAYCNNNPVMNVDPTGQALFSFLIGLTFGIVAGAVIGGTTNGIKAYKEGRRGLELFASIAGGAIVGGGMGAAMVLGGAAGLIASNFAVAGFGLSALSAGVLSFGIGAGSNLVSYLLINGVHKDKKITASGTMKSLFSGGLQGLVTYGIGYIGGENGLFNKLGNFKTMDAFYVNMLGSSGKISLLSSIFYGSSMLLGDTITKALFLSSSAAGMRAAIDRIFGLFS